VNRLAGSSFLCVVLALTGAAGADDPQPDQPEPPVRLKKKAKPNTDPAPAPKPGPKEKPKEPTAKDKPEQPPDDLPEPEADPKETMARIGKNMRTSEDRLAKKDPSDGTRQVQRDILKDLDSLITQAKRQQQQNSQQQSMSQSSDPQRNQQARNRGPQSTRDRSTSQSQRPGQTEASKPKTHNQGGKGGGSDKESNKIADVYKAVWGMYPELMRLELDSYAREKYMARYSELLKQYYATIAEKGRKGD
jgi:hypothetical protein